MLVAPSTGKIAQPTLTATPRVLELGLDPARERHRVLARHDVAEDAELVPADPRHHVAAAHRRLEPGGGGPQQRVPGRMPVAVVRLLQVVEVGEEDREAPTAGAAALERGLERARVEQAGEVVPVGQLPQALDERTVPRRERADERAAGDERDRADRGRRRQHVRRGDPMVEEDAEHVEQRREGARAGPEERPGDERHEHDRQVEEVPDPEPRHLEREVRRRDQRIAGERSEENRAAVREGRIHLAHSIDAARRRRVPRSGGLTGVGK